MARTVLIADDDAAHRRMLGAALEAIGMDCRYAADGEEAVRAVSGSPPDLVLLDLRMPRLDGIGALRRIAAQAPGVPVVVVTAHGEVRSAVEAMKLGARDFLEKPVDIDELRSVAQDILDRPAPTPGPGEGEDGEPRTIVGPSPAMAQVRETVRRAARAISTVLVRGESGTGKELVARAIHALSERSGGPFVAVNCAAVPEGLLESELFGHERGAFTGADSRRAGRFEAAHGGTLFLDEIAEMRPHLQAKLLRVLQERTFERLGGNAPVRVDIRVVAATNRDLPAEIAAGRFREDLYYRLAVVEFVLPPLRERREDVLPTAHHLLAGLRPDGPPRLSAGAAAALALHDWPGNVRELANVLERALLFAGSGEILPEHLPPGLRALQVGEDAHGRSEEAGDGTGVRPGVSLEAVERDLIEKTLHSMGGNRTRTAEVLGLSRRALLYKLKRYGIR
ncbi:MAG: sigma-54 dependent transcriptional regulator [Myxococcota bacterium]|nr:sigma-54 dependent transcriptional regulator [Myxococcota bacterium]